MPVLESWATPGIQNKAAAQSMTDAFPTNAKSPGHILGCANPACKQRRPLSLRWKLRSSYSFDNNILCCRDCLRDRVRTAFTREYAVSPTPTSAYRHRIPIGLLMLSRKWITHDQLVKALALQKQSGEGRLGEWLVRTQHIDERLVARALAVQWGVPILAYDAHADAAARLLLPRLFLDAFNLIPIRIAGNHILYVAVSEPVDRCLILAIEAMTGYRVETGVMLPSAFQKLRNKVANASLSTTRLLSCVSLEAMQRSILDEVVNNPTAHTRLIRIKDFMWLQMTTQTKAQNGKVTEHVSHSVFVINPQH